MTVLRAYGISDETHIDGMTIFRHPLETEPQYKPGVRGVAASLNKLEDAVFNARWEPICSVLGDMAKCMNIKCHFHRFGRRSHFGILESLFSELEEAVNAKDEVSVRSLLVEMLKEASGHNDLTKLIARLS